MSAHPHGNEGVQHVPDDLLGKSPDAMTEAERIRAALRVAAAHGQGIEPHHKAWAIDQIVRVLTGCPLVRSSVKTSGRGAKYTHDILGKSRAYIEFVADYNGDDGVWDTGIIP